MHHITYSMNVETIIKKINQYFALSLQEDWDNSGSQIIINNSPISKILISLDITEEVVDFAVKSNANIIISHHPLIFKPLQSINYTRFIDNIVIKAIKNDINIFSFHTNVDKAVDGLADFFLKKLGASKITPFTVNSFKKLFKVVTFIPKDFIEKFLTFFEKESVAVIGDYKACSFFTEGIGTFYPLPDSEPFLGEKGRLNRIEEFRTEITVNDNDLNKLINKLKDLHPYQEPVIDIYPMNVKGAFIGGFGRIGHLEGDISLEQFITTLKEKFSIDMVKFTKCNENLKVKKIAVCPGSGMSFYKDAVKEGVDIYITGDMKYHEGFDAFYSSVPVIDIGHFHSEIIFTELLKDLLDREFQIETIVFPQKDVFKYR